MSGKPSFHEAFAQAVRATGDGGFVVEPLDLGAFAPRHRKGGEWGEEHADLASTLQVRLEEILLELAGWLHRRTRDESLTLAGGVALNCVANSRLWREGPFENVWVQPASGDSGTALGAAMHVAGELGDRIEPMATPALGRGWSESELESWLRGAEVEAERPASVAAAAAEVIAGNGVVAWFQGRSEYGPRALGHRSLLANPTAAENLARMNDIKGREQFRPVAPMVPFADHVYPTKSGRFELITELRHQPRVVPDFPLTLVTNYSKKWLLSQILEKEHPSIASVRIGTETAAAYGIENGERAIIRSPVGHLEVLVLVDARVGRGMVIMPVGTWIKRGGGANVLTEDIMSNFGQMAAFGETRVRLERLVTA